MGSVTVRQRFVSTVQQRTTDAHAPSMTPLRPGRRLAGLQPCTQAATARPTKMAKESGRKRTWSQTRAAAPSDATASAIGLAVPTTMTRRAASTSSAPASSG